MINTVFTIYESIVSKSGTKVGTLTSGDCGRVGAINTGLHIAINIAGTVLLGASNFTMQCISSPTRSEIDAAHARGAYRDIGLPSLRNLSGWLKRILYGLLVLSTLPLHFFWNSAVFTKIQLLDYDVLIVKPEMLSYPEVNCNTIILKSTGLNRRRGAQGYYNYPVNTESRNLATPIWRNGVSLDREY
ncbi:hypothetical protein HYALB_00008350 [Hymenoscyphus albidus]|uniref:DUF6536 domain-containing protein n=1 Tax=Hymenoscyphus albidus TaxID=595503 RepID=A0A9N9LSE5_9HELO|nr:hypothetical protein HYALB_00008350 [Hymenoscyphus albidus]